MRAEKKQRTAEDGAGGGDADAAAQAAVSASPPHIPGFTLGAIVCGSRHAFSGAELVSATALGSGRVRLEWEAQGSSTYTIIAEGDVSRTVSATSRDGFHYAGLDVTCSCPDGARQAAATATRDNEGRVTVCKHAWSALQTAVDKAAAEKASAANAEDLRASARAKIEEAEASARAEQDTRLPGERERILNGLDKLPAKDVVRLIREAVVSSADALASAVALFPPAVMPAPSTSTCLRCGESFDANIRADRVCRIRHPHECVSTHWDNSKQCYDSCARCERDFNLVGYNSFGRRRVNDPYDGGDYCYEGVHTTDSAVVARDGIDWRKNPQEFV